MSVRAGPQITRLHGQQLARRELARGIYKPSWLARLWHAIEHWLSSLANTGRAGNPGWWGLILLAVVALAAVAAVMVWLGPTRVNKQARSRPVLHGRPRSADEHRGTADQLAADGNYQAAIIERVRAIAVDLETREILLPKPARTAAELAIEASAAFPAEAASLTTTGRLFDDVRYGGRAGTQAGYVRCRDLDVRLKAATASPAGSAQPDFGPAGLHGAEPLLTGAARPPGRPS